MRRAIPLAAVLLAVLAGTGEAQSALLRPVSAPSLSAAAPTTADAEILSAPARVALARESFARPRTLAFGVVGGLIGAGTGFLVSQVMRSDWDKTTNATFASHRRTFALSGAAIGTAGALVVSGSTSAAAPRYVNDSGSREGSGGAITSVELTRTSARNAYEAVAALRPQWLIVRGATLRSGGTIVVQGEEGAASGPPQINAIPGPGRLGAFLDATPLESLDALRDIPLISVQRIEFRTASVGPASGPGHVQRAIVVITADGRTE